MSNPLSRTDRVRGRDMGTHLISPYLWSLSLPPLHFTSLLYSCLNEHLLGNFVWTIRTMCNELVSCSLSGETLYKPDWFSFWTQGVHFHFWMHTEVFSPSCEFIMCHNDDDYNWYGSLLTFVEVGFQLPFCYSCIFFYLIFGSLLTINTCRVWDEGLSITTPLRFSVWQYCCSEVQALCTSRCVFSFCVILTPISLVTKRKGCGAWYLRLIRLRWRELTKCESEIGFGFVISA